MQFSIPQGNLAHVIVLIITLVLVNILLGPFNRIVGAPILYTTSLGGRWLIMKVTQIAGIGKAARHYVRRIHGLRYLIAGPEIIDDAYSKVTISPPPFPHFL